VQTEVATLLGFLQQESDAMGRWGDTYRLQDTPVGGSSMDEVLNVQEDWVRHRSTNRKGGLRAGKEKENLALERRHAHGEQAQRRHN
jgi:hypothetical protein